MLKNASKQAEKLLELQHYAMKTRRTGSKDAHLLNLSSRWRGAINFTLWLLYPSL